MVRVERSESCAASEAKHVLHTKREFMILFHETHQAFFNPCPPICLRHSLGVLPEGIASTLL